MREQPCRILVVDDNHDAADSQVVLLKLGGHDAHVAYDADQALLVAARLDPEVALIDLALPRIDGYQLGEELQKRFPKCKIVAISGYGDAQRRDQSRKLGFRYHLLKPVDPQQLFTIVAKECEEVPTCE
jgi:CheY-like chemotaxis protein